jgi:Xaa-Pro aminopeptidase
LTVKMQQLCVNTKTLLERIHEVRTRLVRAGLEAVILARAADVTYVTGFLGEDSWAVVTRAGAYLITDSRYTEQARQECPLATIIERKEPTALAIGRLFRKLKSVKTVGVDKSVSVGVHQALKKHLGGSLKVIDGLLADVRSIKDAFEIAAIRKAADVAARAFQRMFSAVEPGITECELAATLDLEMRRLGSRNSFDTIVAFGPNASRPHHQPTLRKLRRQDTVLIDFGARYAGYCSDITRCLVLGRPTAPYRRAYQIVEEAQAAAIGAIRAGVDVGAIDARARSVIRESGLPVYGHGTGHGLGLELHEAPFVREKAKGRLRAGQIITVEPGIYIPGKLGIRIEDDILVTEGNGEILTEGCPHALALR